MKTLTDAAREDIQQTLRALRSTSKLASSPWLSATLIEQCRREMPKLTRYDAVRAVFVAVLEELQKESPEHADLLQGRFWEGHTVEEMVTDDRPWPGSGSSFYNHQKEAITRFALLLWEKEQICKQNLQVWSELVS